MPKILDPTPWRGVLFYTFADFFRSGRSNLECVRFTVHDHSYLLPVISTTTRKSAMKNSPLHVSRHITDNGRDAPFRHLDPKVVVHAVLRAEFRGATGLPLQLNAHGDTLDEALAATAAAITTAQQQCILSVEELLRRAAESARYAQLLIADDETVAGAQQAQRAAALCELVRALRAGEQLYSVEVNEYTGAAVAA